jgi:hypothetical protein
MFVLHQSIDVRLGSGEKPRQHGAGVLRRQGLEVGRIIADPGKDMGEQHPHEQRAEQRKGVKARVARTELAARLR